MPLNKIPIAVILKEKSASVYTVPKESTVADAVHEMNRHRIGSVLVADGYKIVGIFTERDVLTRVIAAGLATDQTLVRDTMTAHFKSISEKHTVEDAMQLMTQMRVRHLPVMNGSKLKGMISIGDVTRWLLKANELEAENLRKYAFAEYPG